MKKQKFSELKIELAAAGFLPLVNGFDRLVIELRRCCKCHWFYSYKGFADSKNERSFGVCERCDLYQEFFVNNNQEQLTNERYQITAG